MKQLLKAFEFILDKPDKIIIPIKKEYFKNSNFNSNTDCALARGIKKELSISNKEFTTPVFRVGAYTVTIDNINYDIVDTNIMYDSYHKKSIKDFNIVLTKSLY